MKKKRMNDTERARWNFFIVALGMLIFMLILFVIAETIGP